jgi:hypothetical protein
VSVQEACAVSAQVRKEQARVKRDIRLGRVSVADVLADPHGPFERVMLWRLCTFLPRFGNEKLRRLNVRAMSAGVNLLCPLGQASQRSREWLAAEVAAMPGRRWA